ncbi:SUMF1/EgtB/PvdO family nonheme iron enzyme [Microvirga subterranea]|uniref:Formylglycine-generating enzyme required for sulfatase activity n=1 Tax=Microvirga subterranea TaxID=186651 RepID=A0A370HKD2_9HYPH|nr:SUMF1/EgtB/PvdO family nonheme iron enzyme [Microvirga subterranea]RDI58800.1 formylglycine-generating enzyme required for sulfatase activity [Microvirga subterranea]
MPGESTSHVIGSPRRLAAILAADIAGYSRLMGFDEEGTLARLKRHRREMIEPTIQEHFGRLIKTTGDGFLAMFDSPLEAVRCAIVIQQSMAARNTSLPPEQWIRYRIGVNLGDVIVDPDDVYGDGVNIAARLENMADPGGVYISGGVYEQIKNKLVCGYQSLGDEKLKNITDPVRIYRVLPDPAAVSRATHARWKRVAASLVAVLAAAGAGSYVLLSQRSAVAPEVVASQPAPATAQLQASPAPPPEPAPQATANPPGLPPPPPPLSGVLPIPIPQAAPAATAPAGNTQVAAVPPPQPFSKPAESGTSLRDCQGCPELVRLPGGSFRMGSSEDPSEAPAHLVRVTAFALGRYPVTVGEWNQCVAANACTAALEGNAAAPARNLSWADAKQFVAWLSNSTGQNYRLPSEAEWEYAARAGTTSRYWWGEKVVPKMASCKGCGGAYDPRQPAPVGSFPANPLGLHDLVGSVAQWVEDCWHPNYTGAPADGSAWTEPNCRENVLRGGSWRNDASYARSASRAYYDSGVRYPAHGFRVARSL